MDLAGFVLAHAVWKTDDETGSLLVPFSMTEVDGQRQQQIYEADTVEAGIELGREQAGELQKGADKWALAYLATLNDNVDAVVVEVWTKTGFECQLMQVYTPASKGAPLVIVGDPFIIIDGDTAGDIVMYEQLFQGIEEHEMARNYWGR